jgi:hypothetical protein
MHRALALVPIAFLIAACGASAPPTATPERVVVPAPSDGGPAMIPILVSSELAAGPNRFLFSVADRANNLLAAPDVTIDLLFYDVDESKDEVVFEAESRFLWALEDVRGLYAADITFPSDGRWGTRFNATFPDGSTQTVRADYDVLAEPITPAIGAPAPSVDTPTADDVGGDLAKLSSDRDPEPRFYETSIADALAAKEPFVVVFATPAFCETAMCGPILETVKAVAADHPDLTFINVEPYLMEMRDGSLQPILDATGELQPAAWTTAWNLLTEPYVAVVDGTGSVWAKFEGALAAEELSAAIEAL